MRLHGLTLTAFGPFGATQDVDFDALSSAGLFLLHGPTGAGKTSVLDAVCYGLYGAVPGARQSPGTSLRSDHAPVGLPTEVRLELTVGGRRLEITRRPAQPRPKKKGDGFTTEKAQSWLREYDPENGWQALSRSHQEIGEEITQLIGMSRDQFCQVVLLPQGDFARFLRADAEARGKLLGRLFDTRRFAAVEERLTELRRTAETQVKAGDEQILAIAQRIAQAAGPAAGELPLPDAQPGEPGLSDGVLEWSAVARSGAGNGSTSLSPSWPRPRADRRQPAANSTPRANSPGFSSGTRRRGAAPPNSKPVARTATGTRPGSNVPAKQIASPPHWSCVTKRNGPTERRVRPASAPAPSCRTPLPTPVRNSWRLWNAGSGRSWAVSTPRVGPSGEARRSTPSGPNWSGRPGPTTN